MATIAFTQFLNRAKNDPAVLGVVLIGSRCVQEMVTPHSDYDDAVILSDQAPIDSQTSPYAELGPDIDILLLTLSAFRTYALAGHAHSWNRYTFVHAQVLHDRLNGEIASIV